MKIAIADDNHDILETTKLVLELDGHEAITLSRVEKIWPALGGVDLLLQDMNMPGLDLAVLMKDIRGDPGLADLPVIIFSAELPHEEELIAMGADAVLSKPFEIRDLRDVVKRLTS